MSQLYPLIERWAIPRAAWDATVAGLQEAGDAGREAGALWLGHRGNTATVRVVVFPRGSGVRETSSHWSIEPEVFGAVTAWAAPRGLCLLGVVHIHLPGVPPCLSWTDRHHLVRVPGVLAVVIGNGGSDVNHELWSWYVFANLQFRRFSFEELSERFNFVAGSEVEIRTADAWEVYDPDCR